VSRFLVALLFVVAFLDFFFATVHSSSKSTKSCLPDLIGAPKPREYATQPELDFLNYVLDGASQTDAARWAGLSKGINLTNLMKRPLIDQTFAELQEKRKNQSVQGTHEVQNQTGSDVWSRQR
jgi:hypothetical protein